MTSSIEEYVYTDGIPQDATMYVDVQREIMGPRGAQTYESFLNVCGAQNGQGQDWGC